MDNFYNSFKPNETQIYMRNFKNKNDILYNNLEQNILDQQIQEYVIQIDSKDRDTKIYPNPFDMKVSFNPIGDTYDKSTNTIYKGTPKPTIPLDFSNVKYIKLENIILPRNCYLKLDDNDTNELIYDPDKKLEDQRFLLLNIDEINSNTTFGTNDNINRSFGTIFCEKIISKEHFIGHSYGCIKVFKNTELENIKTWTIKITDCSGNIISPHIDINCNTPNYCICDNENYDPTKCICNYKSHPLNKNFQVYMLFKIGVLCNDLNINNLKN